jgi:polar amino acid transport system substrate-binding protein
MATKTRREVTMRWIHWILAALVGLILGGCATAFTPPSAEARTALAPTGTLRAGILLTTALQVTKDAASGELKGVSIDLGKELARRIGVPFTPVGYTSITDLIGGARSGQWDVAFFVIDPTRDKDVDYAAAHMEAEVGYLVRPGSSIKTLADIDEPGNRIAVANKGGPDLFLSRNLKRAELVRGDGVPAAVDMLKSGKADALAANKATLFVESELIPGSRVLDGRFSVVQYGMATAKGRSAGNAYVRKFLDEAKASGLIKSYIENAGLRGVVVAPPQ